MLAWYFPKAVVLSLIFAKLILKSGETWLSSTKISTPSLKLTLCLNLNWAAFDFWLVFCFFLFFKILQYPTCGFESKQTMLTPGTYDFSEAVCNQKGALAPGLQAAAKIMTMAIAVIPSTDKIFLLSLNK